MEFSSQQIQIIEAPRDSRIHLAGPAGTGKSTAGIERLKFLLQSGVPGHEILCLFPQRNLSIGYLDVLSNFSQAGTSKPNFATFGGLARRGIDLFWPIFLNQYPAFSGQSQPIFLTLESSLYFLSKLTEPLILEEGYFSSVTIQRNRLFSQILDNLNKAAVHGFPHTEIAERLRSAWIGDAKQALIYEHAQQAASIFREYCYQNNLLDYSLQVEIFSKALQSSSLIADYFLNQYTSLIYDNSEEDIPVCHDFVSHILPDISSALVIFDEDAGYRSFLGASPANAAKLAFSCDLQIRMTDNYSISKPLTNFISQLTQSLHRDATARIKYSGEISEAISVNYQPSYPEMVSSVVKNILSLVEAGTSPDDIVILAPYLSDALRFMFSEEMERNGISISTHRPSRALRDEPVTHCLLTLAALAHPRWNIHPSTHDITLALLQTIRGLDLTRAYLLSRESQKNLPDLRNFSDFESFPPAARGRITYYFGNRYQELISWLMEYAAQPAMPLDYFIIHLFGEILSQPGFGFKDDLGKATLTNQIIRSVQKFRTSAGVVGRLAPDELGSEYYKMVKSGVLANQYLQSWTQAPDDSVFLAPAYTFLLTNRAVDYQFWLDAGSRGWYERIYQPLTNPHVLHRDWHTGNSWSDIEEQQQNLAGLACLATGLARRCRQGIYFCLTEIDEHGFEQKGLLIQALNDILNNRADSS